MGGKQADRNAKKKAAKDETEAPEAAPKGSFVEMLQALFLRSTIMAVAPKMQSIMTDDSKAKSPETEPEKKEEPKETAEGEVAEAEEPLEYADQIWAFLSKRLIWHNCLGLGSPVTEEESLAAWMDLKSLELDWGPRAKRNQSPGLDRIKANMYNNAPQYFHVLLVLMMLRALLFRSWFACLPWLVGYQYLSLWVPLDGIPQLPQVPVEKCPLKFRIAASVGIHALVWLFFAYEILWGMWFFEKGMVIGLFAYHGYAVRPSDKGKAQ
jgi:hypothetical protein